MQLEHALQTAESARAAYPGDEYDWLHVVALIHDLGKVMSVKDEKLNLPGEPQWGVVVCTVLCVLPVRTHFAYIYSLPHSLFPSGRYIPGRLQVQ